MSAKIIDGKQIAADIREELKEEVAGLKEKGIVPGLGVILVGADPASQSYVTAKERACENIGIYSDDNRLPPETTQEELLALVEQMNNDPKINGILVQLPLPKHINEADVLLAINPDKDVDGFHPMSVGKMMVGEDTFLPCTPHGIVQMLATVTLCHTRTKDVGHFTRQADIIIAASGWPNTITADMVKDGAVVIDVGVNRVEDATRERGYRLVGDVDFDAVKEKASMITPVPGGVGPMTITMLLYNTVESAKRANDLA
jgi:methylenetetrahydrofolate dehydrogenase (NADP+)/methenyltetrahydrofolate cyclohydrolase